MADVQRAISEVDTDDFATQVAHVPAKLYGYLKDKISRSGKVNSQFVQLRKVF